MTDIIQDENGYRIPKVKRDITQTCWECGKTKDLQPCGNYPDRADLLCYSCRKLWNYLPCEICKINHVSGICPTDGKKHSVVENKEPILFDFLLESKAFRNENMVEKYSVKELGEICFAMMLALHLLSDDAKTYAKNSLKYPKFDRIYLSTTDLANIISTLKNAKEYLNERDVDFPINEFKRYMRGIVLNNNSPEFTRAFFFRLQHKLKITNGSLLTIRREIVDGDTTDKIGEANKLYQQLRRYEHKCDILALLQKLLDTEEK